MAKNPEITALLARMEPEADQCGDLVSSIGEAALISIAVSLKRLADGVEGSPHRTGIGVALAMIADRMPSASPITPHTASRPLGG